MAADITDRLTQLHDSSLKELFEAINGHKAALHDLVQHAHAELSALVGRAEAAEAQPVMHLLLPSTVQLSVVHRLWGLIVSLFSQAQAQEGDTEEATAATEPAGE